MVADAAGGDAETDDKTILMLPGNRPRSIALYLNKCICCNKLNDVNELP
jgi:hypothetical protein